MSDLSPLIIYVKICPNSLIIYNDLVNIWLTSACRLDRVIHRFVWLALPRGGSGRQTGNVTIFGAPSTTIAIIIIS